jgi:hypothetical protein
VLTVLSRPLAATRAHGDTDTGDRRRKWMPKTTEFSNRGTVGKKSEFSARVESHGISGAMRQYIVVTLPKDEGIPVGLVKLLSRSAFGLTSLRKKTFIDMDDSLPEDTTTDEDDAPSLEQAEGEPGGEDDLGHPAA